jgi:phosphoglycolate phosphatase-like HAD superfamily hydrolase
MRKKKVNYYAAFLQVLPTIVFLDFDGTVVDNFQRYYRVYLSALDAIRILALAEGEVIQLIQLGFLQFRSLMREGKKSKIMGLSKVPDRYAPEYRKVVDELANDSKLTLLDMPLAGSIDAIDRLVDSGVEIVLVTCRPSKEVRLICDTYGIKVKAIVGGSPELPSDPILKKIILLKRAIEIFDPLRRRLIIFSGDTEVDILAAQSEKITILSVFSGMRSASYLRRYNPDGLFLSLTNVVDVILKQADQSA